MAERDKIIEPWPLPSTLLMATDLDKSLLWVFGQSRSCGVARAGRSFGDRLVFAQLRGGHPEQVAQGCGNQVFDVSKAGDSMISAGELFQCSVTLAVKKMVNTLDLEAVLLVQRCSCYCI